jgi:hypothetical protein
MTSIKSIKDCQGKPISSPAQQDMIERSRRESVLNRSVPLGYPPPTTPERGPSAPQYFRAKTARGERGRYWPLHQLMRRAEKSE